MRGDWQVCVGGLAGLVLFITGTPSAAQADIRQNKPIAIRTTWAVRAAVPPVLDGRLSDDEPWQRSPALEGFQVILARGRPEMPTEARVLHDDEALYVGVRCRDVPFGGLTIGHLRRDGPVYNGDSIEIFLIPPKSTELARVSRAARYFQLAVSARGVQFDAVGKGGSSWNGSWEARTTIEYDGWVAEIRIPFETLGTAPPGEGGSSVWKINVGRTRTRAKGGHEYSSWSRVARSFHEAVEHSGRILLLPSGEAPQDMNPAVVLRQELRLRVTRATKALARSRALIAPLRKSAPGRGAEEAQIKELLAAGAKLTEEINAVNAAALPDRFDELSARIAGFKAQVQRTSLRSEMLSLLAGKMPNGSPFVVLPGPSISNLRCLPDQPLPKAFQAGTVLSTFAAPGEIEPLTFVLYAPADCKDVRLTVGELTGKAGTLDADVVDPFVLKYWYQSGRETSRKTITPLLVPELLLKDDGLIVVDHKTQSNFMRTAKGLVNISERRLEVGPGRHPKPGKILVKDPKLLDLKPRDAKELQPFDVPAGGLKQIWLTLRLPDDAAAGKYEGTIRVTAGGAGHVDLTLRLEVLPFRLEPSVVEYSIWYRTFLTHKPYDFSRNLWWTYPLRTESEFLIEVKNMLDHGVDNPLSFDPNYERVFALREKAGLPKRNIYSVAISARARTDEGRKQMAAELLPWLEFAKANGYGTVYAYSIDEPSGAELEAVTKASEVAREVGVKVFAAVSKGKFPQGLEPLDLLIVAGNPDRRLADEAHTRGRRIFSYGYPQVGFEEPLTYRRNYGLLLWQAGYDGTMNYAYQHAYGHVWNDFDGPEHRDHVFTYPTVDGVIDTAQWEGFREGVDDVKFASTLLVAIAKAKKDPARKEAAIAAEKWLQSAGGNLDSTRRQIADKIIQLTR